jgi:cell division protein FtsI/penicillin-binding protein 2
MKKKQIILFVSLLVAVLISGCTKAESPIEVLDRYAESWVNQDFESMYASISTKNKNLLTREEFVEAYRNFYSALKVQSINVVHSVDEEELKDKIRKEESVILPVKVEMQTEYGDKSYEAEVNLIKEETDNTDIWVIRWDYNMIYKDMAVGDTIQTTFTSMPVRGEIIDRNGKKLAENGIAIQVGIVPGRLGDMKDEIINDISETFNITKDFINNRLGLSWVKDDTFVDLLKIPKDKQYMIEAIYAKNKGATYKEINERVYPYKEIAAHLTGYLGYINKEELEQMEELGFTANDKVGRNGLEFIFNETLMGSPGKKVTILDKEGVEKEILMEEETKNGEDIQLTIDIDIQSKLYNQISEEQGTAATMDYTTGEVLALVSSPSYDPNKFILGIGEDELKSLQEAKEKPLMNRFTNVYSPGSTLKPITAAIALNENIIDKNFTIDVEGLKWQKDKSWGNYSIARVKDSGKPVDLEKAMIYSDNIYFAQVALKIGADTFLEGAKDFGIGEKLNIRYGVRDSQLATGNMITNDILLADTGFGQGEVLLNILNLNKSYSAFVNDGTVINPKLVMDDSVPEKTNAVTKEVAEEVFNLMLKVVEDKEGTGHDAHIPGKTIAGKTGTAEVPGLETNTIDELGWFVAIDKSDNTPFIISMMIENVKSRGGSHLAVDRVKAFIQNYTSD